MQPASEQEALDLLDNLRIKYKRLDHPAIWTMNDPNAPKRVHEVKSMLLKQKKTDQFYLYLTDNPRIDFKSLADQLGIPRSRLTFASEAELAQLLGLVPGMVTPLALMHDRHHQVQVLLHRHLQSMTAIPAHPNINTATVLLSYRDLLQVLRAMGYEPSVID
jgi:Ala-tRNA(Pro) deacylase